MTTGRELLMMLTVMTVTAMIVSSDGSWFCHCHHHYSCKSNIFNDVNHNNEQLNYCFFSDCNTGN